MGDRLVTIDMGRKLGAVPLLGEQDPHVTQCRLGRGLPPYQVGILNLDPSSYFATTDMGQKLGGCAPLGEGSWVPI